MAVGLLANSSMLRDAFEFLTAEKHFISRNQVFF
jgi:hypothetical protein